ncbi:MAG: TonB-dependent receptor [Gemmatimonadota bacterium]
MARLIPFLLLWMLPLAALAAGPGVADSRADRRPGNARPAPTDTIIRVDTIVAGDSIVRVDTTLAPDTIIRIDTIMAGDSIVRIDTIPHDTIQPVQVSDLLVDILRAPMSLEAVPFAVSVLEQEVGRTGRSDSSIEEALQGLPGVQIHNRFNDAVGERISIRGYGARSEFGVRGVRILVDGVPATLPDGQSTLDHLDLGSLGRVEALRGPGSALYGNAAGGVLHFETRRPPDSPFRQEVRVIEGDHDYRRTQSTTSGQVGEVGYLLNLARYEFGGYRANPLIEPEPGDSLDHPRFGSAVREHLNTQVSAPLLGGNARVTVNAMRLEAENPGSLSRTQLDLGDRRAYPFNVQQGAGKEANHVQAGITWDRTVGDRTVEIMTYAVNRDESVPDPALWTDVSRGAGGLRATIRSEFVGEEGRLWWTLGVDADIQNDHRVSWTNLEGERGARTRDQDERVRSGAVFLQAMLPINQLLDVLTGLRYDRIRFSATDRLTSEEPVANGGDARTLDSASPSFGFHAHFHQALNLYLNLSTAFETPTTTELSNRSDGGRGFNPDLEPQVGITTEVGGRGVISSSLAWELVFFHTTLHNELVPFELDDDPGKRYFRNTARSTREGWEAALQFSPSRYLSTRLVASTNDARFESYAPEGENLSGNRVPGIAPYKLEGIVRVGPGRWFGEVRGELLGPIEGNDRNGPEARSPSRQLVDLRAGINEVAFRGFDFSPFVGLTNVFDEKYNTSVVVNATGGRYFEPGPGQTMYMGASLGWQR